MLSIEHHDALAAQCADEARKLVQAERLDQALPLWQRAVLHYTEAHRMAEEMEGASASLTRNRAAVCYQYGEVLFHAGQYPEAAVIFQEAADLYGLLSSPADRKAAQECARQALAGVTALRDRPQDRLYLLTARYERQRQQLAMQPDTWAQQGECCLHIAQIFLRRGRDEEAYARFEETIGLYQQAEQTPTTQLAQAECHHRLGNLLANVLIDAPERIPQAIAHYEQALALYAANDLTEHGAQESRLLCAHALRDLKRRVAIPE